MQPELTLFGTEACHLCEDARAILIQAGVHADWVEIADIAHLETAYGIRIPVLRRADGAELDWPFSAENVRAFVGGA